MEVLIIFYHYFIIISDFPDEILCYLCIVLCYSRGACMLLECVCCIFRTGICSGSELGPAQKITTPQPTLNHISSSHSSQIFQSIQPILNKSFQHNFSHCSLLKYSCGLLSTREGRTRVPSSLLKLIFTSL